jgi:hypothetical protein
MGRPVRLTDEERKRSNAERQRRWKARVGWVGKARQRESMRALRARRKAALSVTTVPVNNEKPRRDNVQPSLGELRYVTLEEVEADPRVMAEQEQRVEGIRRRMEPKPNGGRVVEHAASFDNTPEPEPPEASEYRGEKRTANEARTYAQLERFKARRAQMEKRGVQVELIL